MKINGNISCNRASDDTVRIEIEDNLSQQRFLEIKLSLEDFALMITGLSGIDFQGEVRNLSAVGKKKISEKRSAVFPGSSSTDRTELEQWLLDNKQEEGWSINTYLGSQRSVITVEGKTTLNYSVYKYVEV